MSTPQEFKPRDQQWLQEMCELVRNKMPATHTFVVFAFPAFGTDRCYYASNATRSSAIEALKQWLAHEEKIDNWMKHNNDEAPPKLTPVPTIPATFEKWPTTPDGRLICGPNHPMPIGQGEAHKLRWAHTNGREVGEQRDGWPCGDEVTMQCQDCGLTWTAELPQ